MTAGSEAYRNDRSASRVGRLGEEPFASGDAEGPDLEEALHDFVENAPVGLHRLGPDGKILWANRAELDLLGYTRDEYVGRHISEFYVDADVIFEYLTRLRQGGVLHECEARLRAKDGSIKHVLVSSTVYERDGNFVHTRGFTRDMTERRLAEQAREQSYRQLQVITDALPVLVAFVSSDGRYTFASAGYERWFGYAKSEVVGRPLQEVLGQAAYEVIGPFVTRALAGETVRFEAEVPYRSGAGRWIEATYIPQTAGDGTLGFVALIADVTERKAFDRFRAAAAARAERLLRITEAIAGAVSEEDVFEALLTRVSESVEASSAGLWIVGGDGRMAHLARSHGYGDAVRERLRALPLDLEPTMPLIDCIRSGAPIWIPSQAALLERYPHLASIATPKRAYRVACLPLAANGRVLGALGVTIEEPREADVEEQEFLLLVARYASQALERLRLLNAERTSRQESIVARNRAEQLYRFAQSVVSAERQEDVFQAAIDAIEGALGAKRSAVLTFDDEGVLRFRAWRGLSEPYRQAVEGHSPWPRDVTNPEPVLVADAMGDPHLAAYRTLFQDERIGALAFFPLVSRGRLLGKFMLYHERPHAFGLDEMDVARAIASHLASVTARFTAMAKLEETLRYNELFAGVLAHDLRNPLGAMMTGAQLLLMRREGEGALNDRETKPLSRIVASGERMSMMIEQLFDFTRVRAGGGIPIAPHPTNLGDLCSQAIGEIELAHAEWTVQQEGHGDLRGTWDSDRLLQVLSNLVANACQHGAADVPVLVRLDGTSKDRVRIEVRNRGAIPAFLVPELFEPFRSTRHRRDRSRGLGLGLFIVREIVRGHGGSVDVTSTEAEGTVFVVQLPRHAQERNRASSNP